MKKFLAILMAATMSVAMFGCGNEPAESEVPVTPSESVSPAEPIEPDTANESEENKIDYDTIDLTEWTYFGEEENDIVKAVNAIDNVFPGTAGSSLKALGAGAELLKLSAMEDTAKLDEILDSMTPVQLDFLSFQLMNAKASAENILNDFDNVKEGLAEAGYADFTSTDGYSAEALDSFTDALNTKLADKGVTNQWKNFPDVEPFNLYNAE